MSILEIGIVKKDKNEDRKFWMAVFLFLRLATVLVVALVLYYQHKSIEKLEQYKQENKLAAERAYYFCRDVPEVRLRTSELEKKVDELQGEILLLKEYLEPY